MDDYKSSLLELFQHAKASSAYLMDAINIYNDNASDNEKAIIRKYMANSGERYVRGFAEEKELIVTDCMFSQAGH